MLRMAQRLRTFLRGFGPGGVRGGAAILLSILLPLGLILVAIWYALSYGQEAAEREPTVEEITVVLENQPEDFPLIFGPGPSPELAEAASADGPRRGIPGLSDMDVIGYLQYIPGTNFRCPGVNPAGGGLYKRVCRSSSDEDSAFYEVTVVEEDPQTVLSVVATAQDAPDDEAAEVLGYVASLSLEDAAAIDAEAWVGRTISSGGQYFADGAEVRLYGTEQTRTLEILATAPPDRIPEITDLIPEVPEPLSPEITEQTTVPSKSR